MSTSLAPKTKRYPRGSEWRRWDLHVHTPESVLANEFSTWDAYIDALEQKGAGVSVLGVTDYCSIEGYKRIQSYKSSGRLKNFDLILPNIEFRTHPEMPDGAAINIHLLVSPEDPDHVTKIEQALQKLTFEYGGNPHACSRPELIALGRAHSSKPLEEAAAFKHGVNNFKPSFEQFRSWYRGQGWLKENSLVVISNRKDGASGLSKDSGFSATRDELYRFSNLIFSPSPKDRDYFLGHGSDSKDEVIRKAGALKACIHGSDAHKEGKLFAPELDRFCWIKADPSFEGLRQVCHEPEDRVHIGPSAPQAVNQSKIIAKLRVSGGSRWFTHPEIELNSGLVAIIGEKGSGKTALADAIAFACGAWNGETSTSSFISKAQPYLGGVSTEVYWLDGRISEAKLSDERPDRLAEVRYLSQDFVEELCSRDVTGNRLIGEIEEVVFAYIDEPDRLGASSFEELRRIRTEQYGSSRSSIRARISKLNSEIVRLEDEVASKAEKEKQLAKRGEELAAIDKQLPSLQGTVDQKIATALAEEKTALRAASNQSAEANRKLAQVSSVKARIAAYSQSIENEFEEIRPTLEELSLSKSEIDGFRPRFAAGYDSPLKRVEKELQDTARLLKGNSQKPDPNGKTLADIQARIKALEEKLASDEKQRERLVSLQTERARIEGLKDRTAKEIQKIDTTTTKALENKREERWKTYLSYFDVLAEEQQALEGLYEPLSHIIAQDATGAKSGFQLSVKQVAGGDSWVETGSDLLDKRRRDVPIRDKNFRKRIEKTLIQPWQESNQSAIRKGLETLLDELGSEPASLDEILVSHATRAKLYDWLFSPEHVSLQYSLSYQGADLEVLSPGTRGIVLLVLYLAMDQNDRRPLIIDQPEGNLDNSSIYDSLVPFLRKAKKNRQVILVTHNPNLVVTTDAEQVIVASSVKKSSAVHPELSYSSGSLENADGVASIRDQALRLLEGGRDPFKMRGNRYAIE